MYFKIYVNILSHLTDFGKIWSSASEKKSKYLFKTIEWDGDILCDKAQVVRKTGTGIFVRISSHSRINVIMSLGGTGDGWRIITGSGSDDWIYWCFFTITLSYNQYSAIGVLHTFHFTAAHALGFSVSTSRILATELHTGIITSNHYEVFMSFLLQSPWTADSPILSPRSPWFLALYSSALICTQLRKASQSQSYVTTDGQSASLSWNKTPIWGLRRDFYYCMTVAGLLMWGALCNKRTNLLLPMSQVKVKVKVTLRLAVYHQSVRLSVKPLEVHDQRFFFFQLNSCGDSPYVTSSLTRI
jgi:hypothetical protein